MGSEKAKPVSVTQKGITDRDQSYDASMMWVVGVELKVVSIELNGGAHFGRKHLLLPSRKADKIEQAVKDKKVDDYIDNKASGRLAHRKVASDYSALPRDIATQKEKIQGTKDRMAAPLGNTPDKRKAAIEREKTLLLQQQAKLAQMEKDQTDLQGEKRSSRWHEKYHGAAAKKNSALNLVTQSPNSIDPKLAAEKLARAMLAAPTGTVGSTFTAEVDFGSPCVHGVEYDKASDSFKAMGYTNKLKLLVKRVAVEPTSPAFEVVHLES